MSKMYIKNKSIGFAGNTFGGECETKTKKKVESKGKQILQLKIASCEYRPTGAQS